MEPSISKEQRAEWKLIKRKGDLIKVAEESGININTIYKAYYTGQSNEDTELALINYFESVKESRMQTKKKIIRHKKQLAKIL